MNTSIGQIVTGIPAMITVLGALVGILKGTYEWWMMRKWSTLESAKRVLEEFGTKGELNAVGKRAADSAKDAASVVELELAEMAQKRAKKIALQNVKSNYIMKAVGIEFMFLAIFGICMYGLWELSQGVNIGGDSRPIWLKVAYFIFFTFISIFGFFESGKDKLSTLNRTKVRRRLYERVARSTLPKEQPDDAVEE